MLVVAHPAAIKTKRGEKLKKVMARSISRIDQEARPAKFEYRNGNYVKVSNAKGPTNGWYVRVFFNNKQHAKFFSDKAYGGRGPALNKAQAWRNKIEKEIGKPRTNERVIVGRDHPTSVNLTKCKDRRGNPRECYQVVYFPEPNIRKVKRFIITSTTPKAVAKQKAIEFKKQKELEIYGSIIGEKLKRKKS